MTGISELRLVKRCAEQVLQARIEEVRPWTRGIYVLLKHRPRSGSYDVVYVGMAGGARASIRARLRAHRKTKGDQWTHFSLFQVWENIREEEIRELEGLFRHIYRLDTKANQLNKQRGFRKLQRVRDNAIREWD